MAETEVGGMSKTRIEALADGIFAIAMTLLVFNLKVPAVRSSAGLRQALVAMAPEAATYAVSFVILGCYWIGHHNQYHFIRRTDRTFLWINLVFLMGVAGIPFTSAVFGSYPLEPVAATLYGLNLFWAGLALLWHWRYATGAGRLVGADTSPQVVRLASRRILTGPVMALAGIAGAWLAPWLGLPIFAAMPVVFIAPSRLDRHWTR